MIDRNQHTRVRIQPISPGLETGEPFWFTAHLGGARDIGGS